MSSVFWAFLVGIFIGVLVSGFAWIGYFKLLEREWEAFLDEVIRLNGELLKELRDRQDRDDRADWWKEQG